MVGFAASLPGAIKDAERWPMDLAAPHGHPAINLGRFPGDGVPSLAKDSSIEPCGVGQGVKQMMGRL